MHQNSMMQGQMMQMNMLQGGMGGMMGMAANMNNPRYLYFAGTPQSLQARLDTMSD